MDDLDLLKAYVEHCDQDAFAQLVRRHGGWLYSAARRQVGDGHLAEDVTQAVFLLLSRRARNLLGYGRLSGWLFITLGYCVKRAMRQRARTERREREAASMRPESVEEVSWDEVAPLLETLVGGLGKADRDAVLLRFYEQKPLAEVGRAMGVSEEAARKRVDRAVEKLRGMLQKQGVTGASAGLSAVVGANAVQEMPARVVEGVMAAVGGGGSVVARGIAQGAMKMMVFGKLAAATAAVAGVVLVAGVGVAVAQRGPVQAAAPPSAAQTTQPSASDRGGAVADAGSAKAKFLSAKVLSLATVLQTLRSQLELYQLHHDGYPTIEQIRDWGVMIKPTTPTGAIVDDRGQATGRVFGPYLASTPANVFTGLTKVADSSSIDGETGWVMKRELRGVRDGNGVAAHVLYAVVPDTPAFRQLFRDAPWVIFSDKVSEAPPATAAASSRPHLE